MSESRNTFTSLLTKAFILLASSIISIPLMTVIAGNTSILSYIFSFMLPGITLFGTLRVYQGKEIFKFFKPIYKKRNSNSNNNVSGKIALPVAFFIYSFVGFSSGVLFEVSFLRVVVVFPIIGLLWGYCVSLLIKNGVFTIDDV